MLKRFLVTAMLMTLVMLPAYSQTPYTVAYNETTAPLVPLVDAVYAEMGIDAVFELVPSERCGIQVPPYCPLVQLQCRPGICTFPGTLRVVVT